MVALGEQTQLEKHKEAKLRAKAEARVRQLEEEIGLLKSKKFSDTTDNDRDMEIIR